MELVLFETKYKTYTSLEEFIKMMRTRLDRFIENAPPIPNKVLKELCKFKNYNECAKMVNSLDASYDINSNPLPDVNFNSDIQLETIQTTSKVIYEHDEIAIHVIEDDNVKISPGQSTSENLITTNDAIKNIEEMKLQRKSNEFDRFKQNMTLRST